MLGEACREHDSCHLHLILLLCLVHCVLVFSVCYLRHPLHTHKQNLFLHGPYFCACCFRSSYRLVAAMGWVPHVPHRTCLCTCFWSCVVSGDCVTCEECGVHCFRTQCQGRGIWNKKEKKDQTKTKLFQQKLSFRGQTCRLPWSPEASTEQQDVTLALVTVSHCDRHNPMGEGSFWLVVSEITQSIMSEGCGSGRGNCVCLSYHGLLRNKEFSDSYLPTRPQLLRPPKPFKHSTRKGLQRQY